MYARIQTTADMPAIDPAADRVVIDVIAEHPGFAGCYSMRSLDSVGGCMITLWETEQDAELASKRTREKLGPRPEGFEPTGDVTYEVIDDFAGAAFAETPTVGAIEYFDGPLSDAKREAVDRTHARLRPVIVAVPGAVRGLLLWQPVQRQIALVGFATSMDVMAAAEAAVQTSTPGSDEDPALLTGGDRVLAYRVNQAAAVVDRVS